MKHFALDLCAISPLAIRADHAADGAETARYIPGTALAGSLATVHKQFYSGKTSEFENLFLSGKVQYPDLYPASFGDKGMQEAIRLPVYPLPKTAQTCKRYEGFRHVFRGEKDVEEGDRHGVRDNLLDWAMLRLAEDANITDPAVLLTPFSEEHKICSAPLKKENNEKCPYSLDHITGYYRRNEVDGKMMRAHQDTRLQTHTGINRGTGTVQEGILYNRRVFDEDSRFWGAVRVSDELAPVFSRFINDIRREGLVRIGTGRTRGMGKVEFVLRSMENEQQRFAAFQQRLQEFDALLRKTAKETFASPAIKPGWPFYFALTLHSPIILRDALLRYIGVIDEQVLENLTEISKSNFTRMYCAAATRRITGWNDLWGTPRTNDMAIETGSVFLFSSSLPQSELEQALFRLEEEGIGQRKTEGFGRICVSDAFHREVELQ